MAEQWAYRNYFVPDPGIGDESIGRFIKAGGQAGTG